MTWRTDNDFNQESICILEITEHFLTKYFGHDPDVSRDLITEYFCKYRIPNVEEAIMHALSWEMAKRVHFTIGLGRDPGEITIWEVNNDLRNTPRDALAYMRAHYWNKYSMLD